MEKLKALFRNKKFVIGAVAVILLSIVCVAFALNQPQTKNEVAQQETISDAEHEKLVAKMKELQEADKIAQEKAEEDKKIAEAKEKEEQPKKEEKKTQPVQPQPDKKEVKVEQKPAPKVEQSKPIVKPEVPKSLPKPPVAPAKPKPKVEQPKKDRYIVSPIKLKGDMVFKSETELNAYVAKNFDDDEGLDKLEERLGKRVIGWRSWTVEWSDGVFEYHLQWY